VIGISVLFVVGGGILVVMMRRKSSQGHGSLATMNECLAAFWIFFLELAGMN
jgi:hypothetical protein